MTNSLHISVPAHTRDSRSKNTRCCVCGKDTAKRLIPKQVFICEVYNPIMFVIDITNALSRRQNQFLCFVLVMGGLLELSMNRDCSTRIITCMKWKRSSATKWYSRFYIERDGISRYLRTSRQFVCCYRRRIYRMRS